MVAAAPDERDRIRAAMQRVVNQLTLENQRLRDRIAGTEQNVVPSRKRPLPTA
ncbi:hypothetical protein ACFQ0M_42710 [Kitasatospora aburaviensis]